MHAKPSAITSRHGGSRKGLGRALCGLGQSVKAEEETEPSKAGKSHSQSRRIEEEGSEVSITVS